MPRGSFSTSHASALLHTRARRQRLLATLLFSDTAPQDRPGTAWHDDLDARDDMIRRTLEIFDGRELKVTEGGLSAVFDIPVDAVRCALRLRDAAGAKGIRSRTGVHTGEIELRPGDACGAAVHLCRRLLDVAAPGEVLVTQATAQLAGTSGVRFEPRGRTRLRGVARAPRLFTASEPRQSEPYPSKRLRRLRRGA